MIYVITGKSASGKDTFKRMLLQETELSPIITMTTRKPRAKEVDGVDYFFKTIEEFEDMIDYGELMEFNAYVSEKDGQEIKTYYGSSSVDESKDWVIVLDPAGVKVYKQFYGKDNVKVIYLDCDEPIRKQRAMKRGSCTEEIWEDRRKADERLFEGIEEYCDYIVDTRSDCALFDFLKEFLNKEVYKRND